MKSKNLLKNLSMAFAAVLIVATLNSCSSYDDFETGKLQLENQGYTDIVSTGHSFFCCSDSDSFSTGFECKDKFGNTVRGCFCSSLFKGITIRFE